MIKYVLSTVTTLFVLCNLNAQHLKPGFEKQEFIELLKIGARTSADSNYYKKLPAPTESKLIYQSGKVGFDNIWQLWMRNDSVAIISIRGTTKTAVSFYANLYAAMVPAIGNLVLEKDSFPYKLSDNPAATVHVGFLLASAYLSKDIIPKIDSCYKAGIKEFIITGHSQGGAITYMLTSYLESLKDNAMLPQDIRFKTYAAASPKPGNLYYAYDFENLTKNGWAYNVVNAVDWVPEVPFSIQTIDDLNVTNPFRNARKLIKKQKFPVNLVGKIAFNQLSKPAKKAQKNYEKWMGKRFGKYVEKTLKGFTAPAYANNNSYVRTGATIVMIPDSSYFVKFPEMRDSIWRNHTQAPYLFLAERLSDNGDADTQAEPKANLNGTWELDYLAGQKKALDSLFPDRRPWLTFNTSSHEVSGNSGCNSLRTKLVATATNINFSDVMAMTRMFCQGDGESVFLETLHAVDAYTVNENRLTLIMGDKAVMHFKKSK
ncbi:MAG: META domain-containing protein [Ferruginibacter sp.]